MWVLSMIEKWRESLNRDGAYGDLLTDLSKAFDCLSDGPIIAKIHTYGAMLALRLVDFN